MLAKKAIEKKAECPMCRKADWNKYGTCNNCGEHILDHACNHCGNIPATGTCFYCKP